MSQQPASRWHALLGPRVVNGHVARQDGWGYRARVEEALQAQEAARSVTVEWRHLLEADMASGAGAEGGLAEWVIQEPDAALMEARRVFGEHAGADLWVRIHGLPDDAARVIAHSSDPHAPRPLRDADIGRLVAVRGLVRRTTRVMSYITRAVFRCNRCGALLEVEQASPDSAEDNLSLKEPLACNEEEGGCGRDSKFRLVLQPTRGHKTLRVNGQRIDLQDNPDAVEGGREPGQISCYLFGDLVDAVRAGDRVTVNGILRAEPVRGRQGHRTRVLDWYVDASSIDVERVAYEDIVITPAEEEAFRELASDPSLFDKLVHSFAPSIHGLYDLKLATILQAFGGVEKFGRDGLRRRGDSHILIIGDPGKAKSVLLRAAAEISPRGIYTNAKTSSGVGLTASVVRDEKGVGNSGFVCVAGPAVLADRGRLALDEADKGEPEDLTALLECLEQGSVTINKAGINVRLNARFAAIVAANPDGGRFDPHREISDQIGLAAPFVSRMDYVFIVQDTGQEEEDLETATTILSAHIADGARAAGLSDDAARDLGVLDRLEEARNRVKPVLERDFVRKYVAFARRTVTPILTPQVEARIKGEYLLYRKRKGGSQENPVPLGPRQLEGIIRMSEQSARARLSRVVEPQDVDRALRIFQAGYLRAATDARGNIDADRLNGSQSHDYRSAYAAVRQVITDLSRDAPPGQEPSEDAILVESGRRGVGKEQAKAIFQRLRERGSIYYQGKGWKSTTYPPKISGA